MNTKKLIEEELLKKFNEFWYKELDGRMSINRLTIFDWFMTHFSSELERVRGKVEGMPTTFPDRESDEYDAGYRQAHDDVLTLLSEEGLTK